MHERFGLLQHVNKVFTTHRKSLRPSNAPTSPQSNAQRIHFGIWRQIWKPFSQLGPLNGTARADRRHRDILDMPRITLDPSIGLRRRDRRRLATVFLCPWRCRTTSCHFPATRVRQTALITSGICRSTNKTHCVLVGSPNVSC
jgi:hypothetical protein